MKYRKHLNSCIEKYLKKGYTVDSNKEPNGWLELGLRKKNRKIKKPNQKSTNQTIMNRSVYQQIHTLNIAFNPKRAATVWERNLLEVLYVPEKEIPIRRGKWIKLNTDGSCKLGIATGGGVLSSSCKPFGKDLIVVKLWILHSMSWRRTRRWHFLWSPTENWEYTYILGNFWRTQHGLGWSTERKTKWQICWLRQRTPTRLDRIFIGLGISHYRFRNVFS